MLGVNVMDNEKLTKDRTKLMN